MTGCCTEANFSVVDALRAAADEVGRPMAQVALTWVVNRPVVASVLMGASRPDQVRKNIASLDITLSSEQRQRLDAVGAPPQLDPYFIFDLPRDQFFCGSDVRAWSEGG